MEQLFFCFSPSVFEEDKRKLYECACRRCDTKFRFGDGKCMAFRPNPETEPDKWNYRALCSYAHLLDVLPERQLSRA